MKLNVLVATMAACAMATGIAQAQEGTSLTSEFNASMRLGLELQTEPDAELSFNSYGSRIGWKGTADAGEGLKALSRLEFGYDQEGGVGTTRFAYLGVEGDFGTVTGGKQYNAFYDAVSSAVDIAFWGSCGIEYSCARESSVVKFVSSDKSDVQIFASGTLINGDAGRDFIDGLDVGVKLKSGEMTIGAGLSLNIGDAENGVDKNTGAALGVSATLPVNDATASATFQFANDNYTGFNDNSFLMTGTYKKDDLYGIVSIGKADDTTIGLLAGYKKPVIQDRAFAYFEAGILDSGAAGADVNLFGRAVMVYNLDFLSTAK